MFDVIVIGCGVVGAATAYNLSKYNVKIGILEAENDVATGTTKANSAIIHAGYDPKPGTLMAKLNVEGSRITKEICEKLDVPYKQVGSLVVAFDEEGMERIKKLFLQGQANKVPNLEILDAEQVRRREPRVSDMAIGALYAPTAAIVNPWELCLSMAQIAVENGAQLYLNNKVTAIEKTDYGFLVTTGSGQYQAKTIFNASGIYADKIHDMVAKHTFTIQPRSGQYFLLDKSEGEKARQIIFQCPVGETKGVLIAPTVHGNLIVGPDSTLAEESNVKTSLEGLDFIKKAGLKSIPTINYKENIRNFAGLRAACEIDDFIISEATDTKGFFDLAGIKSPGLSAAAAIGELSCKMLCDYGMELIKKTSFIDKRKVLRFKELSQEEKSSLIQQNPAYARVICRCETITEGEIMDGIHTPIPPVSIDGVKRRAGAGMGRCQGGFCSPRVMEILAEVQKKELYEVLQDTAGTVVLMGKTKTGGKE